MFARTLWGTNMGLEPTAVGAGPVEANVEAGAEAVEGCGAGPMVRGLGGPVVTVGAGGRGLPAKHTRTKLDNTCVLSATGPLGTSEYT